MSQNYRFVRNPIFGFLVFAVFHVFRVFQAHPGDLPILVACDHELK
jgi:hypothetical protein